MKGALVPNEGSVGNIVSLAKARGELRGRSSSVGPSEVLNPKSRVAIAAALHSGVEPWPFDTYVDIYIKIYMDMYLSLLSGTVTRLCFCNTILFSFMFFLLYLFILNFPGIRGHQYEPSVCTSLAWCLVIYLSHACVHFAAGTVSLWR